MESQTKATLRQAFLQRRRSLSQADWQHKSHQICAHLQTTSLFQQAQTILAYLSFRREPDLSPLFQTHQRDKIWGLPRCEGRSLQWHIWSLGDPLQSGTFGLQEPFPETPTFSPGSVDLILIPAVACDRRGYRLGYGGGYYDRLLQLDAWQHCPTIGIVFEFSRVDQLPVENWDQPVSAVCTEAGLAKLDMPPRPCEGGF